MDRLEKLRLSASQDICFCFKHGLFCRFYEHGLHWFSHAVKPLKPMLERVKGGEPVIYGGLPIASFEKLLVEGALQQVESTEYGWRWAYASQRTLPEKTPEFAAWRESALSGGTNTRAAKPEGRNILAEIAAFDLAGRTPMQAMTAIAGWQQEIREGAG